MSSKKIYKTLHQREKLSDQVVLELVNLINRGDLCLGDQLPPERELAENFGVSRTVIREAIRSLTAKGLLEVRAGSGAVISVPDVRMVAESMSMIMKFRAGDEIFTKIFEVRRLLEVEIARLAAVRATSTNLKKLGTLSKKMGEDIPLADAAKLDVEFHTEIAKATQNEIFPILLDSVNDLLLELRNLALSVPGAKEKAIEYHHRLAECIKKNDPDLAGKIMAEHLDSGESTMRDFINQRAES